MPSIIRLGDPSDHGGSMVSATGKSTTNGIKTCVSGDMHSCPQYGHGTTSVVSSTHVTDSGKGIIKVGDRAGCGAILTNGSPNISSV